MTKKDFQDLHRLTDEEMKILEYAVKLFNGKIISIEDKCTPPPN